MNLPLILMFSYLIFCCYTDIKTKYIPFKTTIAIGFFIIIFQYAYITINNLNPISFITSFIPGILLILLSFVTRESIGYGDSILLALCTITVGTLNGIFIIMCSFIYSSFFSLFLLICGRKKHDSIPFVPFIFLSLISYILLF